MTTRVRRILVAVRDLQHLPANQLRKAATLAKASGASIELFHAIMEPDPGAVTRTRSRRKPWLRVARPQRRGASTACRKWRALRFLRDSE